MKGTQFSIQGRQVGNGAPAYVIAEVGVNHDGAVHDAISLVDAAADAGADAVKFQTFDPEALVSAHAPLADYQAERAQAANQLEMLDALVLDSEALARVVDHCRARDITFLSTPFDEKSASELDRLGVPAYKVGSGDLTNVPFLRSLAGRGRPMIVSTGMATLEEVDAAVDAVSGSGNTALALLRCISSYPTPPEKANLRAMDTLRGQYPGVVIGYSDHCLGTTVSLSAVARGAAVLERHITLDRTRPGPDHAISLEPRELKELVKAVRTVEAALGDGIKAPSDVEANTRHVARRSLVAARDLPAGRVLAAEDLAIKRPGGGLPPADLERVIGAELQRPLARDELLRDLDIR